MSTPDPPTTRFTESENIFGLPSYFWRDIWIETSDPSLCARSRGQRHRQFADDKEFRAFRNDYCKYFMSISPQQGVSRDREGSRQRDNPADPYVINVHLGFQWMNEKWLFDAHRKAHILEIERLKEWSLPIPPSGFNISFVLNTVLPAQLLQDAFYYKEKLDLLTCLLQMGAGFDTEGKELFRVYMEDLMGRWTERNEVDKWITIAMRYELQSFTQGFLMSLPLCPPEPKVARNVAAMLQLLHRKGCINGFESTPLKSLLKTEYSRLYAEHGVWPGTSYGMKLKWAIELLAGSHRLAALIEKHPDTGHERAPAHSVSSNHWGQPSMRRYRAVRESSP